ncbi:hypothetical protein ACFYU9_23400 [Streptomyces sp. NPDC004327]|uniref:hypothetical protein n=1 Tax=Streptomyces sp. NPDC004327 TaxID=3364699 RepID=UPI0036A5CFE3
MLQRKQLGLVVVALCLGGALTACGTGDDGEGYAAVGGGQTGPQGAVKPSGAVTLVPLDPTGSKNPEPTSSTTSPSPGPAPSGSGGGTTPSTTAPPPVRATPAPPRTSGAAPTTPVTTPAPPPAHVPSPQPTTTSPPTTKPPTPAALTLSAPVLTDTDRRWCENVTVTFRNTGGTAARSGTVGFATHVIGALGIDWATVNSSQPLPAPIAGGAAKTRTYTVCVDSWRVPLGMRIDTREVTASWQ